MSNQKGHGFKLWYALSFAFQLGFIIVAPIGGFLILGLWVDSFLQTTPLLMIVGMFLGIIVTAYEIYHFLDPLIEKKEKNIKK